ncbi:MAG: RecQ family ATP-dependent DNA helicase [Actinobacteria bacterium]|nr:RecQ family ATP-dependent DNA helicase [Actinomycetota bacterium]
MVAATQGRDVLAVMPTGYGKSAIYEVLGASEEALTLVISPLIALQRDQVRALGEAPGAQRAVALNSSLGVTAEEQLWQDATAQQVSYLFLSPEQLANDAVLDRLRALKIGRVAVDEAHCVSAWGHDFRPDYLAIGSVVEQLGHPVVIALTATAAPPVREEIIARLGLRDPVVVVRGFDRPNLELAVHRYTSGQEKEAALLREAVERAQAAAGSGVGLVYVARRRQTEDYAAALRDQGVRAYAYHAGLPTKERNGAQKAFDDGELDVVVATSAFGMGIDHPHVRFVLHDSPPGSVDDYYQEIGRAGRDGEPAAVTLHYRPEDLSLRRFFSSKKLPEEDLRACLQALGSGADTLAAVRRVTGLGPRAASAAVNLLVLTGALNRQAGKLHPIGSRDPRQVLAEASRLVDARERIERSRVEMMRGYAETQGCRREFLLSYFGEDFAGPCGSCDNCLSGATKAHQSSVSSPSSAGEDGFTPGAQVVHEKWAEGTVMRVEDDRITVFFEEQGYRTLDRELVADRGIVAVREPGE